MISFHFSLLHSSPLAVDNMNHFAIYLLHFITRFFPCEQELNLSSPLVSQVFTVRLSPRRKPIIIEKIRYYYRKDATLVEKYA